MREKREGREREKQKAKEATGSVGTMMSQQNQPQLPDLLYPQAMPATGKVTRTRCKSTKPVQSGKTTLLFPVFYVLGQLQTLRWALSLHNYPNNTSLGTKYWLAGNVNGPH